MIAALVSLALLAPAPAGAGGAPPLVSLAATPSRVVLASRAASQVVLTNAGRTSVRVTVAPDGLALDLRGRPTVRRAPAGRWLLVRPRALTILPGATATVEVRSAAPRRAEPGDHHAVVLFTTRPLGRPGVSVRMRVGVRVVVRVAGTIVRRLRIERLRVRGRNLELTLANGGNVTEQLPRGRLRVELRRSGRLLARLYGPRRELLPRTRGVVSLVYGGRARGVVTARVAILGGPRRSFRVGLGR